MADGNESFSKTLSFNRDNFDFTYATGRDPATGLSNPRYGYNTNYTDTTPFDQIGTPQIDLLNASFFNDAFVNGTVTFTEVGQTESFRFGLGFLVEDYIAVRPIGSAFDGGAYSWPYDPEHPEELDLTVDVTIPGTGETLSFSTTPLVVSGPALFILQQQGDPRVAGIAAAPGGRTAGFAPTSLPGSAQDAAVDFQARFAPQEFTIDGYRFQARIEDLVFDGPDNPASAYPSNPSNPIDSAVFRLTLTLLEAPDDGTAPSGYTKIDWEALAERVTAYLGSTGQWGSLDDWLGGIPPDGGSTDYLLMG